MTPETQEQPTDHLLTSLELIYSLNAVATALQDSIRSEDIIYQVFQEQVIALGLRGGISELDDKRETLNFKSVAFSNPLKNILGRFEKKSQTTAVGYSVPVDKVDIYQQVVRQGKAVFVDDTSKVSVQVIPPHLKTLVRPLLTHLGSPPGIFVPLVYGGEVKGMLNMVGANLSERDLPTLQAFANQIAVALENARLVKKLDSARQELEVAYEKTLEGWVQALDLRDSETIGHTLRSAELTVQLASFMGVEKVDLPHVRRGALLHDIGKMAIPDAILRKPGPLSSDEWVVMKQHPLTAYLWLSGIEYLNQAVVIPYNHHEHWDGSGYTQGLRGDEIPFWARLFTIVDVWDAMTNDRPYRKAIPAKATLQYIHDESGKLFDPQVVEAFFDLKAQAVF